VRRRGALVRFVHFTRPLVVTEQVESFSIIIRLRIRRRWLYQRLKDLIAVIGRFIDGGNDLAHSFTGSDHREHHRLLPPRSKNIIYMTC
jgi:hypothetical protein